LFSSTDSPCQERNTERLMMNTADCSKKLLEIDKVIARGRFKDTWDSLSQYHVPEWYRDARFGIFIHWGVYSVPAFGNEWYPRNMYIKDTPEFNHHVETYGSHARFGYKDYIPLFKAERFDPAGWARLFAEAGAKYIVPVSEHHDGFQMYKSNLSEWNAAEKGPKKDIIGELKDALDPLGFHVGVSSHRLEHWFFMGHGKEFDSDIKEPLACGDFYWAAQKEPDFQDLQSEPVPSKEYLEDWLLRCCELVDSYRPKIFYFDWWIQHSAARPYLRKFAAYYYNRADEWDEEVVINYKHEAFMFGCAVPDVERGQFAETKPYFWQTDTAIARNSWCYTENNEYKSAKSILCDLVDIVSKNGTLLLNVGPRADGTISSEETAVLREIGAWLKLNGESVFGTRVWRKATEGPTKVEEGQFTDGRDKAFTSEDFRFVIKGNKLYATCLNWPENGQVSIASLAEANAAKLPVFHGIIQDVEILGQDQPVRWRRDENGLHVDAPFVSGSYPVVIRITLD
jgi:alpha-L-fucosidase